MTSPPQVDGEPTALADLLARVEAATAPDRELDARLHVALHPHEHGMIHPGRPDGSRGSSHGPLSGMDWDAWSRLAKHRGSDLGMVANHGLWPDYTASLNAALTLVERALPGWDYRVERDEGVHKAGVWRSGTYFGGYGTESAPTPALALLAALLRALIAKESGQ